jgi:hypothetical protein
VEVLHDLNQITGQKDSKKNDEGKDKLLEKITDETNFYIVRIPN